MSLCRLRQATEADLAGILALEEGFQPRERWSERSWADELAADTRTVLVSGSPVRGTPGSGSPGSDTPVTGVISVQQVGGVAELHRIVVDPAYRRNGVGDALLTAGTAAALAAEAEEMLLEVRADNTAAVNLYARHGFREIARRSGYYGAGVDAVIMRVQLETAEWESGND